MPLRFRAAFVIAISTIAVIVGCDSNSGIVDETDAIGGAVIDDGGAITIGSGDGEDSDFTDDNFDGIRDDVNVLIDEQFSVSTPVKTVAEQLARGTQNLLDAQTEAEAVAATEIIQLAVECTYDHLYPNAGDAADQSNAASLRSEIEGATVNTRERVENYYAASGLMGGVVFELRNPTADECF